MKIGLTIGLISACSFVSSAQETNARWLLGAGITYCSYINNFGLNVNFTYRIIRNLHVGPDFSAFLNHEFTEDGKSITRKELEYNFNAHYLFKVKKQFSLYPLLGINWSNITNHPENELPQTQLITALNTGAGVELRSRKFSYFFESKWVSQLDKYDFTVGLIFPL